MQAHMYISLLFTDIDAPPYFGPTLKGSFNGFPILKSSLKLFLLPHANNCS